MRLLGVRKKFVFREDEGGGNEVYQKKDQIKDLGFKWDPTNHCWYTYRIDIAEKAINQLNEIDKIEKGSIDNNFNYYKTAENFDFNYDRIKKKKDNEFKKIKNRIGNDTDKVFKVLEEDGKALDYKRICRALNHTPKKLRNIDISGSDYLDITIYPRRDSTYNIKETLKNIGFYYDDDGKWKCTKVNKEQIEKIINKINWKKYRIDYRTYQED